MSTVPIGADPGFIGVPSIIIDPFLENELDMGLFHARYSIADGTAPGRLLIVVTVSQCATMEK